MPHLFVSQKPNQRVEKALAKLISRVRCSSSQPSSIPSQSSRKQAHIPTKDKYITQKELKKRHIVPRLAMGGVPILAF